MARPPKIDPYVAAAVPVSSVHKDEQVKARRERRALGKRAKRKKREQKRVEQVATEQYTTLAADLTPTIGDIVDPPKKKPPPRIKKHPGGGAVELLKAYAAPKLSDAQRRRLRYNLALQAPVSEPARKQLRKTRDPSLPPILQPQPGRVIPEPRGENFISRHSGLDEVKDAVTDGLDTFNRGVAAGRGAFYGAQQDVADFLISPEEREVLLKDVVYPAMEDVGRWSNELGAGIDWAGAVAAEAAGDVLPKGRPQTGRAFRPKAQVEFAGAAAVPAEVLRHTAKVIRNSVVGLSQISLGLFPGLVYGILDPKAMATATKKQYELYYGPLINGDFKKFLDNVEEFPLQIPLDVIAVMQAWFGVTARFGAVARNMKFVNGEAMIQHPQTGELRPVTRTEALMRGMLERKSPTAVFNDDRLRWSRQPNVRHTKAKVLRPVATEDSELSLRSLDTGKEIGTKRLSPRISAKKNPELVGIRAVDEDGVKTIIDWQGERWTVEGIWENQAMVQRFAPRSDVGRFLTDIWNDYVKPSRFGYRQNLRNITEQRRAVLFSQVNTARSAARWVNRGAPGAPRRARRHAFDRMMVYGSDAVARTRQEIRLRHSDPQKYQATAIQRGELADLERALPLIENPPAGLTSAIEGMGPLADKTQEILIRARLLHPETAKEAIRSQVAWLADEGPLPAGDPIRDSIEHALFGVADDPGEAALGMHFFDSAARSWAADTGRNPIDFYSEHFGGAEIKTQAEMMMLFPDTAVEGTILFHVEEEVAKLKAAEDAGIDYPRTAEVSGEGEVARWDRARNEAIASGHGAFLDATPVQELVDEGYRLFVSQGGDITFSIAPNGDLGHLSNTSPVRGAGRTAILHALREGARTLDAFDGYLPPVYREFGFREVARTRFVDEYAPDGWNYERDGRPDIIHMGFVPWADDWEPMYVSYEEGKQFATALTMAGEGRTLYREFYSKMYEVIEGFPEKVEINAVVNLLKKRGVSEDEIRFHKVEQMLAQLPGKSVNRGELLRQFDVGDEMLPASVEFEYPGASYEPFRLEGGVDEQGTIFLHHPRRLSSEEYSDYWATPEGSARAEEEIARQAQEARAFEQEPERMPWDEEEDFAEVTEADYDDIWEADDTWAEVEAEFYSRNEGRPPPDVMVYESPHFGAETSSGYPEEVAANLLAHARFSLRTINGKKTMVIEELQSDWAAEVRSGTAPARITDAPLMKAWPLRMVKEVLAYAADNGIERIAWTTGKQQADRYSKFLQTNVRRIEVKLASDMHQAPGYLGTAYKVKVEKHSGEAIDKDVFSDHELKGLLGADIYNRVIDDLGHPDAPGEAVSVVEGENMTIGTGLGKFYDEMLPKLIQKYLGKEGIQISSALLDKIPIDLVYSEGLWHAKPVVSDPRALQKQGGEFLTEDQAFMQGGASASREALLYAMRRGEAPAQVVRSSRLDDFGNTWAIRYSRGSLGADRFPTHQAAVAALDKMYAPLNKPGRTHMYDLELNEILHPLIDELPDVEVPYFDLTPQAVQKIQRQTHFRAPAGIPIAALHHPNVGSPLLYFGSQSDLATFVHELTHGVMPNFGKQMQAAADPRTDIFKSFFDFEDWDNMPTKASEEIARTVELMFFRGSSPYPHMRDSLQAASRSVRDAYSHGERSLITDEAQLATAREALKHPELSSVLQDMFDFGRGEIPALDAHFVTRARYYGLAHHGHRIRDFLKSSMVPAERVKSPVKKGAKLTAIKEGTYEAGTEPVLRYAAEAIRTEVGMEAGRWVTEQAVQVPIDPITGMPNLPKGMRLWRPGETHTTQEQAAAVIGQVEESGFNIVDLNEQELAEVMHDIVGASARQQTGGRSPTGKLPTIQGFASENKLSMEQVIQEMREGKILMAPEDMIHAYLDATVGAWTLEALNGGLAMAVKSIFMVPNELAKWRMITKPAYTILNTANAEILGILQQGVFHPWNMRVVSDRLSSRPMEILHYYDALVGAGTAELGRLSDIRPRGAVDAAFKGNQAAFHKILNVVSTPERRLRRTAIEHEFRRYGLHTTEDILEFKRLAETDPILRERELAIGRLAEEAMIRFRGMRPAEQNLVRNFLFVYGWLRAATRFTLRYPIEHPYLARTFAWAGDYGWEEVRKKLWAVPWRYAGGMPSGLSVEDNRAMMKMLDLNPLLPQATASEFIRALWNVGADQNVSKDTLSDLLAPGAELGLSVFFGEDNWGNTVLDQIKSNYLSWDVFPGVMWAMRFADPGQTETNLRAPTDRMGVMMMFLFGQTAPQTYKVEALYQRWLDDLPLPVARVIQHQQDAANLRLVADTAFRDLGGLPQSMLMAIEASEALAVGRSYTLALMRDQQKKDDPHGPEITELPDAYLSGAKLKILKKLYPAAGQEVETLLEGYGYDRRNEADWPGINAVIDNTWEGIVENQMAALRGRLRALQIKLPAAESYLWGSVPMKVAAPAYRQFGMDE